MDDEVLLLSAGSDAEAFGAFYRRFERRVLGFFVRATDDPELAADLTAETFASALESLATFDRKRGRADQWLFGIARNVLGKSYRRGRVDAAARERLGMPTLVLDDHALNTIARLASTDEVAGALELLPDDQRQAIVARVIHERGYKEIARELQCSEAVARKRVSRGLHSLRTRLAGQR